MRSGRTGTLAIILMLAPLAAIGDGARDEALRAIRDQAGAIHEWVESAERPAWLDTNPQDSARAAGESLGRSQREHLREGLPSISACRDLGRLCPSAGDEKVSGAPESRSPS